MEEFGHRTDVAAVAGARRREPVLNAPWPALALVGVILGGYAIQSALLPTEVAASRFGLAAEDLAQGRWSGVVTSLFVHGGWAHAVLNALAALAFGAPVARMTGSSVRGAGVFFVFYLACGVLSSLAYAAVAPELAIGASGAVSGLMAAASRIAPASPGRPLAPLTSRPVIAMGVGWLVVNLLIGLTGAGLVPSIGPVAWQAHLAGYAAGLLLAPAARRLARGSPGRGEG